MILSDVHSPCQSYIVAYINHRYIHISNVWLGKLIIRFHKNIFRDTLKVLRTPSYFDFECTFQDRALCFLFWFVQFFFLFFSFFGYNYERPQTEIFRQANKEKIGPGKKEKKAKSIKMATVELLGNFGIVLNISVFRWRFFVTAGQSKRRILESWFINIFKIVSNTMLKNPVINISNFRKFLCGILLMFMH